jgi:hypothetical protein
MLEACSALQHVQEGSIGQIQYGLEAVPKTDSG